MKMRKRVGLVARGVMAGGLLLAPLAGCFGETSTTGESAPVCVDLDPAVAEGGHRLVAAYLDPYEPVDDVPITRSRTCFTVQPKRLSAEARSTDEEGELGLPFSLPLPVFLPGEKSELRLDGAAVHLAVYADGDGNGRFTPAGPDGGPDHVTHTTMENQEVRLAWLKGLEAGLRTLSQHQVIAAMSHTANGRPFGRFERYSSGALPWSTPLKVGALTDTTCWSQGWSKCAYMETTGGWIEVTWADGRVPFDHFGLVPQATESEVMGPVDACAQYDRYLIAMARLEGPGTFLPGCQCERLDGRAFMVTLADDPPAWLECPEPTAGDWSGEEMAAEAGLDLEAIEAESWSGR